jgi:hypothetical protein
VYLHCSVVLQYVQSANTKRSEMKVSPKLFFKALNVQALSSQ